ncbi:hypothetical protein PAXRUDRAFT_140506 [Paxillus rubicundulus Ve08.2h10]|uniref:DEAD/DEAH-box helicase domain-containing protein n=1 Tax=Paxillus rubicundulus Ve08.2h10 TaxID=930991 RepID=A0A0D0D767_9AGAM|nr:hypothetical protein PAXRUDRAFT_161176 [Paxillus rubicundulus Ve08.2h10]KIK95508.1 hypothetical protein PAXRUDRAFT_140506 [Paxillus rubicundulus Ve08.2h10]
MVGLASEAPSLSTIQDKAQQCFGKRACLWQLKIAEAFLKGDCDIVCIAGTSMGKTLSFWLPLLFRPSGIQIVVRPLNQLGQQNIDSLAKAGIKNSLINPLSLQAIEELKYCTIIVSPEQLMKPKGEFEKLLWKPEFASRC